jgi:hypothetical protein
MMDIEATDWFPLDQYAPVREGWYEVRLVSGETAFSRFSAGDWTDKPVLVFTHWRGLAADPDASAEHENFDAQVTAAQGVRAVWDAFFPGLQEKHDRRHGTH